MVDSGRVKRGFPYILLIALRRVSGAVSLTLSLAFTTWFYGVEFDEPYYGLLIIAVVMALMLFPGKGAQVEVMPPRLWNISLSNVSRWGVLVAILLLLGYATKTSAIFSRKALFTWFIVTPFMILFAELFIDLILSRLLLSTGNIRRVVIAGAGDLGDQLARKIRATPLLGMKVEGFFDDRGAERLAKDSPIPVLGNLQDLPNYVRTNNIDLIFLTLPIRNIQRVTNLLDQLHDTTASIYFVPDVFVFDLIQCRTSDIDGLPIVALCETPFQGMPGFVKAISDYAIASIVLIFTSPLFLIIAIAIKSTSPGKVIFKQRRYGLDGREIVVYKFRSMTVSEDSNEIKQATRDDERVTKIGAFLRRTSLDELPQFINVLQGRMSVVGPRPHAVAHNEEYRPLIKGYMMRHKVKPGITGLAQVMGYRGETATVDAMQKRVEYDLNYLRNWSLTLDLRIIIKTLRLVFDDRMAF
jgi:putative colanic acid biosynthesis UDP-glucose lipid carrier transferase